MGYLADITKQINEGQDVIFVGTGIIIVDNYSRIFMACRTDNNQWSLPGGSLEVGESLESCIIRETVEETGIQIKEADLHLNSAKAILQPVNKNGNPIFVVSVAFWATEYNDIDLQLDSREFTKYGWFTSEEIDKLSVVTPYSEVALKEYKNNNH